MISGRNIAGEESMTHGLSSHGRKQVISGQKGRKTRIDDLRPVGASKEVKT